jgi:D-beta-D-heptose 7-phosphate kinase/D-beta-D-heptose 1-phosphate adenosyltransferase
MQSEKWEIDKVEGCHVLVVGDLMLDRYLWGDVKRISPEAPVPVFHIKRRSEVLGGAGNVVSNLVGLGCKVSVIGIRGSDAAGLQLSQLLQNGRVRNLTTESPDHPTITKTRVVSSGQQLIRLDDEETKPLDPGIAQKVLRSAKDLVEGLKAIILSDYGKGLLQIKGLSQALISMGRDRGIPVLVDPKGRDWERYQGATCVTPNTKELELVKATEIADNEKLLAVMRNTLRRFELQWLLVTRGSLGMCLMSRDGRATHIPTQARQVYDVSGAGDTVISTLAFGVAAGLDFPDAARLANLAAGIVVGKLGTQPINLIELKALLHSGDGMLHGNYISKVASRGAASVQVEAWKAARDKIVFTNGCFDLLHPGHIHLLHKAKELGDRLVVGLNADISVSRLKGSNRPILKEHDRALILGSLDCVDLVVIFEEETPENLIRTLRPDILVKGADYRMKEVVGHETVEAYGGTVHLIPVLEGYSTTGITRKVMQSRRVDCTQSEEIDSNGMLAGRKISQWKH